MPTCDNWCLSHVSNHLLSSPPIILRKIREQKASEYKIQVLHFAMRIEALKCLFFRGSNGNNTNEDRKCCKGWWGQNNCANTNTADEDSTDSLSVCSSHTAESIGSTSSSSSSNSDCHNNRILVPHGWAPLGHVENKNHRRHDGRRRTVRFDESQNKVFWRDADHWIMDDDECWARWYSEADCRGFKQDNNFIFQIVCSMVRSDSISKVIQGPQQQQQEEESSIDSNGHPACSSLNERSYGGALGRAYLACWESGDEDAITDSLLQQLQYQCRKRITRTGLEYRILYYVLTLYRHHQQTYDQSHQHLHHDSQYKYETKHERRYRQLDVVGSFQQRHQPQQRLATGNEHGISFMVDSRNAQDEALREQCERISKPSRLFAHALALAQQEQEQWLI